MSKKIFQLSSDHYDLSDSINPMEVGTIKVDPRADRIRDIYNMSPEYSYLDEIAPAPSKPEKSNGLSFEISDEPGEAENSDVPDKYKNINITKSTGSQPEVNSPAAKPSGAIPVEGSGLSNKMARASAKMWAITLDNFTGSICSAISGFNRKSYMMEPDEREEYIEIATEYAKIKGEIMSADVLFYVATIAIVTGKLIKTYQHHSQKKANIKKNLPPTKNIVKEPGEFLEKQAKVVPIVEDENKINIDYSDTPEFKQRRRRYELHAKGTYRHTSNGKYIAAAKGSETPTVKIKRLIDKGLDSDQIQREIGLR